MSELLTAEQMGERLGLRPATILLWARNGKIPGLLVGGRGRGRFYAAQVRAALRRLAEQGVSDADD